jgi:hypothetical protein
VGQSDRDVASGHAGQGGGPVVGHVPRCAPSGTPIAAAQVSGLVQGESACKPASISGAAPTCGNGRIWALSRPDTDRQRSTPRNAAQCHVHGMCTPRARGPPERSSTLAHSAGPHATSPRRPHGTRGASLMPDTDPTPARRAGCCWTSPPRPAKSPASSTKPATYTCPSSPASAMAETRWSAGRSCSNRSFPKPASNR